MHIKIDKCEELIVHNHAHSCSSLSKYFTPPVFYGVGGSYTMMDDLLFHITKVETSFTMMIIQGGDNK